MSRKVVVISELYYPEETSTGYFMTRIAEGLAQRDPVHAICGQPNYAMRGTHAPVRETHNGVRIERCWSTTLNKDNFGFRLVNVVSASASIFWKTLSRLHQGDVVLVVTNPPLLPFFVAAACRLRNAYCILRIDDVYPDVLAAAGLIKPTSLIASILNALTKALYRRVDRIVVLGRDMALRVSQKLGVGRDQVAIIPNWADLDLVAPHTRSENRLLQELEIERKFVVGYAGNIGPLQDIGTLLKSASLLESESTIHFLFIGSGKSESLLVDAAKEGHLKNLTFLGQRPRSEQPTFLNACDIAVVSLVPGMTGISVPSRLYNFLAAGKPILAVVDNDSEIAKVVREEQVGWIVPPGQPEKVAAAILEASSDAECLAQMGQRARAVAQNKYAFSRVLSAYREMIQGLNSGATRY